MRDPPPARVWKESRIARSPSPLVTAQPEAKPEARLPRRSASEPGARLRRRLRARVSDSNQRQRQHSASETATVIRDGDPDRFLSPVAGDDHLRVVPMEYRVRLGQGGRLPSSPFDSRRCDQSKPSGWCNPTLRRGPRHGLAVAPPEGVTRRSTQPRVCLLICVHLCDLWAFLVGREIEHPASSIQHPTAGGLTRNQQLGTVGHLDMSNF